jgi:hypothetical protein
MQSHACSVANGEHAAERWANSSQLPSALPETALSINDAQSWKQRAQRPTNAGMQWPRIRHVMSPAPARALQRGVHVTLQDGTHVRVGAVRPCMCVHVCACVCTALDTCNISSMCVHARMGVSHCSLNTYHQLCSANLTLAVQLEQRSSCGLHVVRHDGTSLLRIKSTVLHY